MDQQSPGETRVVREALLEGLGLAGKAGGFG